MSFENFVPQPNISNDDGQNQVDDSAAAAAEAQRVAQTLEVFNRAEKILKAMQTPQSIQQLTSFSGNPAKLHSFIKSVENMLPFLDSLKDTPFEQIWLQAIRAKIIGDADQVLEMYGTPLKWIDIKNNLIAYYNDKRDSVTLTRELFQIQQTKKIEDFFGEVQHLLSLLINHTYLATQDESLREDRVITHRENALQVFLAGLKEPIGGNVRARRPSTLKQAFDAAVEERNFLNRHTPSKIDFIPRQPKSNDIPPSPPHQNRQPHYQAQSRIPMMHYNSRMIQQPQFGMQYTPRPTLQPQSGLQFNSRPMQQSSQQIRNFSVPPPPLNLQFPPPRNAFGPRSAQLQRPTPMEVDTSIRTNKINYMNRPQGLINYHESCEPYYYDPYVEYYQYYGEQYEEPIPNTSATTESLEAEHPKPQESEDELNFHLAEQLMIKR